MPEIKLVTLQGVAGTGKTLLALAGALEQKRLYKQIYLARPIVPLSNKDIGFLPGDIKSKLNPYMEPLYDNLKFIKSQFADKEATAIDEMLEKEKLVITPLAYIRGRSLSNICFIVDEAKPYSSRSENYYYSCWRRNKNNFHWRHSSNRHALLRCSK